MRWGERLAASAWTAFLLCAPAQGSQEGDLFEFFAEEALVITAGRQPQPRNQAPATVHVVTGSEIIHSGEQTLWDALRRVPGVDVMTTRTLYGEVSIRGLNRPVNNRTLVLLDGQTVLNSFFDFVNWEGIPVAVEEIDRIEVVEGPTSALYGANAINGVVNIITKRPEQLDGGAISLQGGEYRTHGGSLAYGKRRGRIGYRVGTAWRTANRFEQKDRSASEVGKIDALLEYEPHPGSRMQLRVGGANVNTQLTIGASGIGFMDGWHGFSRFDAEFGEIRLRAFWNRGRMVLRDYSTLGEPNTDYDTYDVSVERSLALSSGTSLVVGGGFRRNTTRSKAFVPEWVEQNLWSMFGESQWAATPRLTLVLSGRLDRHPFTGVVLSPRGSAVWSRSDGQVFRLSAGTAFRNPTLTENYLDFEQVGNPPSFAPDTYERMEFSILGNRDLQPEQVLFWEAAHRGYFGRLRTSATGFHYRLRDVVVSDVIQFSFAQPVLRVGTSFANGGETRAWGGELGAEMHLPTGAILLANYAYLRFSGQLDELVAREGGPTHKVNLGARAGWRGWALEMWLYGVSRTTWAANLPLIPLSSWRPVDGYLLVNGRLGYAFAGRLRGWRFGMDLFNLLNHEHYQLLPPFSATEPGQGGERLQRRLLFTLSFQFNGKKRG